MYIFRPELFLVWAAERKTGLLFGAFIIGLLALQDISIIETYEIMKEKEVNTQIGKRNN